MNNRKATVGIWEGYDSTELSLNIIREYNEVLFDNRRGIALCRELRFKGNFISGRSEPIKWSRWYKMKKTLKKVVRGRKYYEPNNVKKYIREKEN